AKVTRKARSDRLDLLAGATGRILRQVGRKETAGLPRPQLGIEPALMQKGLMRSLLDDFPAVDDDEAIERRDGRQSVCDGDDRLSVHDPVEVRLDRLL